MARPTASLRARFGFPIYLGALKDSQSSTSTPDKHFMGNLDLANSAQAVPRTLTPDNTGMEPARVDDDGPRCLAVMYHYVRRHDPSLDRGIHSLSPAAFTAQLGALCRELEPIEWSDLCAWMRGEGSIPDRCFLLTFDDGLRDHVENVVPILEAWNLRGVFFVAGAVLTSQRMLPAHAVHLLMAALGEADFERELLDAVKRQCNESDPYALVDAREVEKLYHYEPPSRARLKYLLAVALPRDVRNRVIHSLFERHVGSSSEWSHRWYLGREDLETMQSLGHTIGGHGFDHDPYTRLALPDRVADLRRVGDALCEVLGPGARPFSYPFGRVDPETAEACRNAGFAGAFTTEAHWIGQDGDAMRLPRVDTIHVEEVLAEGAACPHP